MGWHWRKFHMQRIFFHYMVNNRLFDPIEKNYFPLHLSIYTCFILNLFVLLSTKGPQIAYERSFRWKLAHFRYLCQVCVLSLSLHRSFFLPCTVVLILSYPQMCSCFAVSFLSPMPSLAT